MKTMSASKVGFPCDRNIYYAVNGFKGEVKTSSQRIFDTGSALEPLIIKWLNQDGWRVFYNPGSQTAALALYTPINGGCIGGHPDAFISKPNFQNVLADIKTMNERAFISWKRNGTIKDKPQYADQLHVYAYAAMAADIPVDKLAIVGMNKNTSELHIDFFDYSEERMNKIIERSERILNLDTPPEQGERMESWACSYCEYAKSCELYSSKRDTHVDSSVMNTNDPIIIDAVELLKEARELSKAGRELENDAKAVLDEQVRAQGVKSVKVNNLILTLNETSSARFDTVAFKKAYPEIAQDFIKTSNSVVYNIKEAY